MVIRKKLPVVWTDEAKALLREIIEYVRRNSGSVVTGRMVGKVIKNEVKKIPQMPRAYQVEQMLDDLVGEFRYLLVFSFKIIFEIEKDQIVILDIFHTSRNPQEMLSE